MLFKALKECNMTDLMVLAWDFNGTISHVQDRNHKKPHPQSGNFLKYVLIYFGLVDA